MHVQRRPQRRVPVPKPRATCLPSSVAAAAAAAKGARIAAREACTRGFAGWRKRTCGGFADAMRCGACDGNGDALDSAMMKSNNGGGGEKSHTNGTSAVGGCQGESGGWCATPIGPSQEVSTTCNDYFSTAAKSSWVRTPPARRRLLYLFCDEATRRHDTTRLDRTPRECRIGLCLCEKKRAALSKREDEKALSERVPE